MGIEEIKAQKKSIGRRIKEARKAKKLTQAQLSRITGIGISSISDFENGKKSPGIDSFGELSKALNTSIDHLYFGSDSVSFIEKVSSRGEKIVNCIYELFAEEVISEVIYDANDSPTYLNIACYWDQVDDFISSLGRFRRTRDTYPDPEAYIEQVKGSIAAQIDSFNRNPYF